MFAQLNGLLRQLLREKEGRAAEPSACVIDAQSVKTSTSVPAAGQGIDAGKTIVGRKRNVVTDTIGLLLAVLVTAASVQDSVAGTHLLDQVAAEHPGIRKVWVDGGYRHHLVEHAATLGIDMEITQRQPGTRGFTPIPKRWAVERTYGRLMLHRRLAREPGHTQRLDSHPGRPTPVDPSPPIRRTRHLRTIRICASTGYVARFWNLLIRRTTENTGARPAGGPSLPPRGLQGPTGRVWHQPAEKELSGGEIFGDGPGPVARCQRWGPTSLPRSQFGRRHLVCPATNHHNQSRLRWP